MTHTASADRASGYIPSCIGRRRSPRPIELWRLHGATDDLRGLAIETSYGYAFGLELAAEIIWLHLQPSLEQLVAYADRLEAGLLAQGWRIVQDRRRGGTRVTPLCDGGA